MHIIITRYINILTSKTQCQVKVWLCLYKNVVPVTLSSKAVKNKLGYIIIIRTGFTFCTVVYLFYNKIMQYF